MLLFNRYEYDLQKDYVGQGGFSEVYKALDTKLNRIVALKFFKGNQTTSKYTLSAEIKRVIGLEHPNICRYFDVEEMVQTLASGRVEKTEVAILDFLDGGSLAEYFSKCEDSDIRKKLLEDVLRGLSYLHDNGIIHRDIKPDNILIKETIYGPEAKIVDFGISKNIESSQGQSSSLLGSIEYMAPEQFNVSKYGVNGKITTNVDLWAFGIMTYELLNGVTPFGSRVSGDTTEQLMHKILNYDFHKSLNYLQEPYSNVLERCIVKNAVDRVQTAGELLKLLDLKSNSNFPNSRSTEVINREQQQYIDTSAGDFSRFLKNDKPINSELSLEGKNVVCEVTISSIIAENGGDIFVHTIEGKKIKINVPAQTPVGRIFQLGGLGLPLEDGSNTRGNQLIKVKISDDEKREDVKVLHEQNYVQSVNSDHEPAVDLLFFEVTSNITKKVLYYICCIATLLCSLYFFYVSIWSTGGAWHICGGILMGVVSFVFWALTDITGDSKCPNCVAVITNVGNAEGHLGKCNECQDYYRFYKNCVWQIQKDFVAEEPSFEITLPDKFYWPSLCCECGVAATREVEISRNESQTSANVAIGVFTGGRLIKTGGDKQLWVRVPHCDQHSDGAKLSDDNVIKFRSYNFLKEFIHINQKS